MSLAQVSTDQVKEGLSARIDALRPALRESGLPDGTVTLLRSRAHAAAHALFTMPQVRLAVARGSGFR